MKKHRKITLALVAVLVIAGLVLGAVVVLAQDRTDQKVAGQTQVAAAATGTPETSAEAGEEARGQARPIGRSSRRASSRRSSMPP